MTDIFQTLKFTRAFGCDESRFGIHSVASRYHKPTLFHVTHSSCNFAVECPKITEQRQCSSELLQRPKRREIYVPLYLGNY